MIEKYLIPVARPKLPKLSELRLLIEEIDRNRIYSNGGPILERYESEIAKYFDVPSKKVVLLANATLALQAAVQVSSKKKWITQDYTFAASAMAIAQGGKTLILCDIDKFNWQLDLSEIKSLKHSDNYGIMPVLPFGSQPDLKKFMDFKDVVFDAAASLGAERVSYKDLPERWKIVYSLHATKVLPAGEGAIVVCGSEFEAQKLRRWGNFGFDGNRVSSTIGTNAKMSEYACAIGLTSFYNQVNESAEWKNVNRLAQLVDKKTDFGCFVGELKGYRPYWIQKYPNEKTRNIAQSLLLNEGIQTRIWWSKPMSEMPVFSNCQKIGKNNSKKTSKTVLGLPMYRDLTRENFELIESILLEVH